MERILLHLLIVCILGALVSGGGWSSGGGGGGGWSNGGGGGTKGDTGDASTLEDLQHEVLEVICRPFSPYIGLCPEEFRQNSVPTKNQKQPSGTGRS
ncbi:short stature homeobox protein 2-like isoform X2 [Stegodyphus dumicola]|uniref:short stature homeobox protein 2-like isoform X2 n=1 Tax=Stegodyphus dumicola TaxID=202533 RepID=UPI0015AA74CB|nr:short stature homeobox protein 2-like isoform X2 [Stegodyphus dumicola]